MRSITSGNVSIIPNREMPYTRKDCNGRVWKNYVYVCVIFKKPESSTG